jgi:ABC-2 type transport system permease protein
VSAVAAPPTTPPATPVRRDRLAVLRLGLARGGVELKEFAREREAVVFTFALPIMLLVVFGAILDYSVAPGISFVSYFVPGIAAAGLFGICFQALAIELPIARANGLLKILRGTPLPPAAFFLGKVIVVAVVGAAEIALLLLVAVVVFGFRLPASPDAWLTFGWVTALGAAACTLLGIAFSSVPRSAKSAPAIVTPVSLFLQFISGVFFVLDEVPGWMQTLAALFPLKWMAQGMRAALLPPEFARAEPAGSYELDRVAMVLAAWVIGGLVLSVATFRWSSDPR